MIKQGTVLFLLRTGNLKNSLGLFAIGPRNDVVSTEDVIRYPEINNRSSGLIFINGIRNARTWTFLQLPF